MSDGKELTYAEVSEHTSKKDLFIVVHDEVFNASSFVDEHPYVQPYALAHRPVYRCEEAGGRSRSGFC